MLHRDLQIRLCRARNRLRETCDCPPSVRDVAREIGLSPYHFIRVFKAVFGETPNECRIRARLTRAKHLLLVSDRSVTEICLEVGYSSLGTFSDVFARRVGLAPSLYRRKVRAMARGAGRAVPEQVIPGCMSLMRYPRE